MSSRYLIALSGVAALAFACGPRGSRVPEGTASAKSHVQPKRHRARAGEPAIAPTLGVRVGERVAFALDLVNVSAKKVEVRFADSRTHDFVVLDSTGSEVWRWSRARMFTQLGQSRAIGAGDSITFEESWSRPATAHGRFTAVALVASENYPVQQRVDFTLP